MKACVTTTCLAAGEEGVCIWNITGDSSRALLQCSPALPVLMCINDIAYSRLAVNRESHSQLPII